MIVGETFRCSHPRIPENSMKWGKSKRLNSEGRDVCACCYRAKMIARNVDLHMERERRIFLARPKLTRGERIARGIS